MTSLAGKVALITGGGRGIGAGIAERLAADGADVAITYNTGAERADAVVGKISGTGRRGLAIAAPATDAAAVANAVQRTVDEFGRLDVLVNNAGIYTYGTIDELTLDQFDEIVAVHVRAVFVAVQAAIAHLPEGGRIINIGSNLAERVPGPGLSLYSLSKSALVGFTKGLARDLGPRGITANVVQPGSTDTEMNPADGPEADAERALTALGRYATPADIAATVAHLAGESGRNITGTSITVDGGANA
ncbi:NAD(P)-dependent dehydrogenase, short-chain alcohol dehydrogenase family [Saccharopolyspora antimicrobica]|uniref:NAD(P)-dependent dehydrogenase (Short-subunit alcohol dehydrogenase family) n=1 Tax=Saccharopolyspora antimicrobica TaxID=455193 RepID=A0A1I5ICH3_9PSEU|nr:SDR family oxidoreductase [Saccharopolyspora antimicrobica]RKT85533.1 NAD(P)-dependent dehydrogenase (short-subunit alcohol dehydrogenase family) [Saccharopolyspora antimicrobica]SFO58328.1 NAD(P)-dependent dehydrogenase, short-chain alcohol dehydrogenase family [Saccharopolyspora antimicrobica]